MQRVNEGFLFSKDDGCFLMRLSLMLKLKISEVSKKLRKGYAGFSAMDRLLVGDVGFGKTEVAMQSCF